MGEISIKFQVPRNGSINQKHMSQIPSSSFALELLNLSSPNHDEENHSSYNDKEPPNTSELQTRRFYNICIGLFYALVSGLFFSLCAGTVKYLDSLDPGQIACYQYIGICVFSLPMVVFSGNNIFGPTKICRKWIVFCGVFDALTVYLAFVSFRYLPLSDASVITSSVPVFVTIFARIFLKELCNKAQMIAVVISVIGVALVSKVPLLLASRTNIYTKESIIGILASLGAVATESGVYVFLRKLHDVDVFIILFNFGWISAAITAVLTSIFENFKFSACGYEQWLIVAVGGFSFISQMTLTKALELEDAGPVSVLMAAGDILLAFVLDAVIFYETPDIYTLSGTVLIITSVVIVGFKKWFDELPKEFSFKKKIVSLISTNSEKTENK